MGSIRAGVFLGDGSHDIREWSSPDPPDGGALLQVEACGLCCSDLAQLEGDTASVASSSYPVVPGHEVVGRVAALGRGSDALAIREGDRVCVNTVRRCGICGPCRSGRWCEDIVVYGYMPISRNPGLWGGYGEQMVVESNTHLIRATESVSAEEMTLFEPLANAVNWVEKAGVRPGMRVVIQGPGHQGLCVQSAVHAAGALQVIVTGKANDGLRLETARLLGAHATIDVDVEDPVERVRELTDGQMADIVFDIATGAETVPLALRLVRQWGRILVAGYKHSGPIAGFETDVLVDSGIDLLSGTGSTHESMETAVSLIESGKVDTKALLGEVFTLARFDEAVGLLARRLPDRDAVRVVLQHR